MGQYTLGAFEWTVSGPTSKAIRIGSIGFPTNPDISVDDSGQVYDEAMSLVGFDPVATGVTKNLEELLQAVAIDGECVGSSHTIESCQIYSRKVKTCVDSVGSSSHLKKTVTKGMLRLGTLTASRNQDATLSFILDALSNAGNAPVAFTPDQPLPSIVSTAGRFRLGRCAIGGQDWDNIDDVSIEFNVSVEKEADYAQIYNDSEAVLKAQPVLVVRGRDLDEITGGTGKLAFPAAAAAHSGGAITMIQLVKLEDSASYHGAGESEHIAITAAGLIVPSELESGSAGQRSTNELRIRLNYDGSNAPLIITANTTYDTTPAGS